MKFVFKRGLIWVSITVSYKGKRIEIDNCIFDTGSATTAIDIDLIKLNYNLPSKIKRLFGIGDGSQDVICQTVDAVGINGMYLQNVELEFGDLKGRLGINGFVGNDILSHFRVAINYSNQILEFFS